MLKKTTSILFILSLVMLGFSCSGEKPKSRIKNAVPCAGDPCFNPRLAPQTISGYNGGRFGKTRSGGFKDHDGLDLLMPKGSKLFAMADGMVLRLGDDPTGYGNYIVYLAKMNSKLVYVMYAHISKSTKKVGDVVHTGDLIAYSGDTGNLMEARDEGFAENHMHLEIREYVEGLSFISNNQHLDPEDFMRTKLTHTGMPEHQLPCHKE